MSGFSDFTKQCAEAFPTVATFIPKANLESLTFLLASSMLGRFLVGAIRCVADYPTLNTKPNETDDQKVQTFSERLFMEGLGVPAGFVFIALGQDLGFKLAQKLHPQSHPQELLQKNKTLQIADIQKAFVYTFNRQHSLQELQAMSPQDVTRLLKEIKNPLHKNLFENAKQHRFVEALEGLNPAIKLSEADWKNLEGFFRSNNLKTNSYSMLGGLVFSTLFSGVVWQWLNDGFLRKKIEPPLVKVTKPVIFKKKISHPVEPKVSEIGKLQPTYAYATIGGMAL